MTVIRRLARPLLASVFIADGLDSILRPDPHVELATPAVEKLHELTGLPDDPYLFVRINGAIQVTAGVALAASKFTRVAAWTLALALIPTTYAGQPFWSQKDPETRRKYRQGFMRNVALLGGLILAGVDTEGRPGLAWRARNARERRSEISQIQTEAREAIRAAKNAT